MMFDESFRFARNAPHLLQLYHGQLPNTSSVALHADEVATKAVEEKQPTRTIIQELVNWLGTDDYFNLEAAKAHLVLSKMLQQYTDQEQHEIITVLIQATGDDQAPFRGSDARDLAYRPDDSASEHLSHYKSHLTSTDMVTLVEGIHKVAFYTSVQLERDGSMESEAQRLINEYLPSMILVVADKAIPNGVKALAIKVIDLWLSYDTSKVIDEILDIATTPGPDAIPLRLGARMVFGMNSDSCPDLSRTLINKLTQDRERDSLLLHGLALRETDGFEAHLSSLRSTRAEPKYSYLRDLVPSVWPNQIDRVLEYYSSRGDSGMLRAANLIGKYINHAQLPMDNVEKRNAKIIRLNQILQGERVSAFIEQLECSTNDKLFQAAHDLNTSRNKHRRISDEITGKNRKSDKKQDEEE